MLERQHHVTPLRRPPTLRPASHGRTSSRAAAPRRSTSCACGGGCPRCQASSALQVGDPRDSHEHAADAVAHRVMRRAGLESRPPAAIAAGAPGPPTPAPASVRRVLSSPGRPLSAGDRAFFEPRFGRDLSRVRVHTGAAAERSAREISAAAYTAGRDIVFGNGRLAPQTPAGRRVMAHELAHVLQHDGREPSVVRRFFLYAAGYPSPYINTAQEIESIKAGTWMPWSMDFGDSARAGGGGLGVTTIDGMFGILMEQGRHSITSLGLIGHGAGGVLGFGGVVAFEPEASATFSDEGAITSKSLLARSREYLFARDRFAETGATITLYACHSGTDKTFVENMSQAFGGICVRAFSTGVDWCISSNADGTIGARGWTRIGDSACQENIRSLTPDIASAACGAAGGAATPEKSP